MALFHSGHLDLVEKCIECLIFVATMNGVGNNVSKGCNFSKLNIKIYSPKWPKQKKWQICKLQVPHSLQKYGNNRKRAECENESSIALPNISFAQYKTKRLTTCYPLN